MAFAIHIRTESSDDYIIAFDGEPKATEILKGVKERLGDEFKYISDYNFDATYDIKFKIKL